jgi:hypothetical protein
VFGLSLVATLTNIRAALSVLAPIFTDRLGRHFERKIALMSMSMDR